MKNTDKIKESIVFHFNSTRKRMTTLFYHPNNMLIKYIAKVRISGQSEIILGLCTKILSRRGPIPIT